MKHFFAALLLLLSSAQAFAQSGSKPYSVPLAGTAVLRDVEDKYNAHVYSLEAPEPDGAGGRAEFKRMKEEVERRFPRRRDPDAGRMSRTAAPPPPPVIVRAFVPDSITGIPPDNYLAVNGDSGGIHVMNTNIATVNVRTGAVLNRRSLNSFTSSVGIGTPLTQQFYGRYDPKVMYDPIANRFFFVTLAGVNQYNWIILAFSQTSDPDGAWNFYKLYGNYANDTLWFDYPTISITRDEVFLTGNKLIFDGSFQLGFRKSVVYQIRKRDGYAGDTLRMRIWDSVNFGGAPVRNIFPVKGGSSLKGPEQYFLSVRNMASLNDSVFLLRIGDTIGGANHTMSIVPMKSNLTYGFPPNGRQRNATEKLQTNDARVLGAYIEDDEIQFVSTTVQPSTGADAIYHGIIRNVGSAPSVTASYITVDTMDFAYPNISYSGKHGGNNTSIISFDYAGPRHFPGVAAVFWDGSAHSSVLEVKRGDSSIRVLQDTVQRWGDYTGSQPHPGGAGSVWTVGLYGRRNRTYGNWMALLGNPNVSAVPLPTAAEAIPSIVYPNPAAQYIRLRFNLLQDAHLRFAIYTMTGALVDEVTQAKARRGENEMVFNTAALPPGQYLLLGSDASGAALVRKTFVKN